MVSLCELSFGDTVERTYENSYNTLGRNNRIYHHPTATPTQMPSAMAGSRLSVQDNTLDMPPMSNYYSRQVPPPLFLLFIFVLASECNQLVFSSSHRIIDGQNHSRCNDNVTFGKRNFNDLDFLYLNGLDRSEAETTTEL